MKHLLYISAFLLISFNAKAQSCSRTGTFVGAGDVDVKGSVTLEEQNDGSILLKLSSDFVSDAGPDLDIYLGSSNRVNGSSIKLQALSSLTGAQTYTLPNNISVNQFEYVTIHCTQYNHYYGAAQLGAISGTCQTLGTNIIEGEKGIEINSNGTHLLISSDRQEDAAHLIVYDLSGAIIFQDLIQIPKGQLIFNEQLGSRGVKVVVLKTLNSVYSNTLVW